jgi:hypothetical protein
MNIRLNTILKTCYNKNSRKGFIKYITSLDYNEFENMFLHYTTVFAHLFIKYSSKKIKKYSKDWFKEIVLNDKYDKIYALFAEANFSYILEFNKNIGERNKKREKILQEIEDVKKIINSVFSKEFVINLPPSQYQKIEILMLICNSIYAENELKRLIEELNKTK